MEYTKHSKLETITKKKRIHRRREQASGCHRVEGVTGVER